MIDLQWRMFDKSSPRKDLHLSFAFYIMDAGLLRCDVQQQDPDSKLCVHSPV